MSGATVSHFSRVHASRGGNPGRDRREGTGEIGRGRGPLGVDQALREHAAEQGLEERAVAKGQQQAKRSSAFLAPPTWKKIRQRDRFFRMLPYLPLAKRMMKYFATRTATGITLAEY